MNIEKEVAAMEKMSVNELREKFAEVCGETTLGRNKTWLIRRIAWRLQANAEGGLSERALARARELANDADLRILPPRDEKPALAMVAPPPAATSSDSRLPPPGSVIARKYKGREVRVSVLAQGFEWDGQVYPSLSAAAKAITGSHCNGFLFFKLNGGGQ